MATYFISDIHLSANREDINKRFVFFLENQLSDAEHLYILGDLFDIWLGDDMSPEYYSTQLNTLRHVTEKGVSISIMQGNRDFLLGEKFIEQLGCTLITDPTIIDLYGTTTVLTHGDILCTDDVDYQAFRREIRKPEAQSIFLSLPPQERMATAQKYREESLNQTAKKSSEIMDVNQDSVAQFMTEQGVTQLIHGHTHRPNKHEFILEGKPAVRWVLSDWDKNGQALKWTQTGSEVISVKTR